MYKIVRVKALTPETAAIDLEDAVNLFLGNGWYLCGGHQLVCYSDPNSRKLHFMATQAITNSLANLSNLLSISSN